MRLGSPPNSTTPTSLGSKTLVRRTGPCTCDGYVKAGTSRRSVNWARAGRACQRLILKVIAETARALHYAHEVTDLDGQALKVVHRDVSPHNIMVTPLGATNCSTLAWLDRPDSARAPERGSSKEAVYLSPEQVRSQPLVGRSDLFCLGIVFWGWSRAGACSRHLRLEILEINKAVIPDRDLKADCPPSVAPCSIVCCSAHRRIASQQASPLPKPSVSSQSLEASPALGSAASGSVSSRRRRRSSSRIAGRPRHPLATAR